MSFLNTHGFVRLTKVVGFSQTVWLGAMVSIVKAEIIEMRHWPTISMCGVLTRSAGKKYLEYLPIGGHVDIRIVMINSSVGLPTNQKPANCP